MNLKNLRFNNLTLIISFLSASLFAKTALAAESIFKKTSGGLLNTVDRAFGGAGETIVITNENLFIFGIFQVINYLLSFIGVIFFIILVYGGYLWMFARGNEDQVLRAKKITREVIIGIIIIVLARVFVEFILSQIGESVKVQ